MKNTIFNAVISASILIVSLSVQANLSSSPEVQAIQHEWARLNFLEEFKNKNYRELQSLAKKAFKLSQDNPDNVDALVWDAIVLSTLAGKKGGMGALSLVKEAKLKLEKAEQLEPTVLNGSVYSSLATLYAKVPGWPLGFGSDKKAQRYFEKALALDPDGLEVNYFYAEFLADNNQDELALEYVNKALIASVSANRPIADEGRRREAIILRDKLLDQ
jgi:tetratricopeptide (TPR) repeat protein